MNRLSKNVSILIQLFCIVLLSALTRFLFLDRVPVGITNDELDYVLNAKAVWLSGKDIGQRWNPLSLTSPTSTFPMAELPSVIASPFIGPFSFSLLHSRWGYALIGVLLSVVLYFLSYTLFRSRKIAFVTGLISAINPWGIFFSRTALESPMAATFYFLFFLLAIQKNKKLQFLSLLPFFVAFFSYIGTKLLAIPAALIPILYLFQSKRKNIVFPLSLIALSLISTAFFVHTSISNPTRSRMGELLLPTSSSVIETVDRERKNTLPTPLNSFMSNKISSFLSISLSTYLNAFSPNLLFLNGDTRSAFSVWDHGYFYLIDLVFMILGFFYMAKSHKSQLLFLGCIILISPLPSVLSTVGVSYPLRSSLLFPALVCIIGYGIVHLITDIHAKKVKLFVTILLIFLYGFSAVRYVHIYMFRNPIANSEGFDFSSRIVSSYIQRAKEMQPITVLTGAPITLYKHFLFDSNGYTKETIQKTASDLHNEQYSFRNVSFETCAITNLIEEHRTYIVQSFKNCEELFDQSGRLQISQVSDNGSIYFVYNDTLCKEYALRPYIRIPSFHTLDVEKLTNEEFCQIYLSKPKVLQNETHN